MDGVYAMTNVPNSLVLILSGAGDGEVRLWNLSTQYDNTCFDPSTSNLEL
jgi:hypothetical protein